MHRLIPALLLFLATWPGAGAADRAVARQLPGVDQAVGRAAILLASRPRSRVMAWLLRQRSVRHVTLGRDGATVEVEARDGSWIPILSSPPDTEIRASRPARRLFTADLPAPTGEAGRALVLEPFATQLSLGPHAGDIESGDLRAAGFQVDEAYDAAVTLSLMSTISRYNVVYMLTHSGVNQWGEGVVATGQLVDDDPSVAPLIADQSVLKVGVVGSDGIYYGIMSHYIGSHLAAFPPRALVFVNGCMLLRASLWWGALQSKGVAAMVSWDYDGLPQDDQVSAAAFFNALERGLSVDAAMAEVKAMGYGRSAYQGQPAQLGYLGDGSLTLAGTLPATPTPSPTPLLPSPTPSPTSTPAATISVSMRARVRPGERQVIRSVTQPGRSVSFQVTYANGDTQRAQTIADAQGIATYSYAQRSSTITRRNTKATVRVTAGSAAAAGSYTVAYGPIDISVEPRRQHPGGAVIVWVHSLARTAVSVAVSSSRRRDHVFSGVTDAVGWIHTTYRLPSALSTGVVQFVARRPGARTSETVRIQSNSRKLWIQSPAAGRVAGSGRALLWLAGTQNELVGTSVPVAPSYAYTERARKRGTP